MPAWKRARLEAGAGRDGDVAVWVEVDGVDGRGHQAREVGVGGGRGRAWSAVERASGGEAREMPAAKGGETSS
jgi:hypothetical protein